MSEAHPDEVQPLFHGQGSYAIGTTVEPTEIDGNRRYDLDDGISFISPKKDRKEPATYYRWIIDAVGEHTEHGTKNKNTCVRVEFADGHHIDLPTYWMDKEEDEPVPQLGHLARGWRTSDPRAFVRWFRERRDPKLVRLVKYYKALFDYQKEHVGKLPSGFVMTILIESYRDESERDDVCVANTASRILIALRSNGFSCYRPTPDTSEDLLADPSADRISAFSDLLDRVRDEGTKATNNPNQLAACEIWSSLFGPRFSCVTANDELESANQYERPPVTKSTAKSACSQSSRKR